MILASTKDFRLAAQRRLPRFLFEYIDGGAYDVGAHGVLLGRAWAFALAANGGAGVSQLPEIFAREMRVAMALTSVCKIGEIDRSILA